MAEETKDAGHNNLKLRQSVRERIRNRGNISGDGGNSSGNGGSASGNGGRVSGNDNGATADAGTGHVSSDAIVGTPNGNSLTENNLRIVGQPSDGRTPRITDTAGRDSNRSTDSGTDTGTARQHSSEVASVISIDEIESVVPAKKKVGRPRKDETKKPKPTGAPDYADIVFPLSIALDFVFSIPVALGGKQFAFWALDDDEKTDLVDSIKDVLEAFPSDNTEQFIKAMEKWIPLLTLGINLYGLMKPRLLMTQQVIAENRKADAKVKQTKETGTPVRIDNHRQSAFG